ncbi:hypothetical protein QUF74_18320 [Candidatus Halobeggiatoa sp. HSG11]|nr:hypothetical protein [Candidatus Halobeggiatoa sp. HSG11]
MPFLIFIASGIITFTGLKLHQDSKTNSINSIEKFSENSISDEHNTTQNNLTIASLSLFLASIGSVFYIPFLIFASVIGIVYTTTSIWQNSYHSIFKEHQLSWSVVESVAFPWLLLAGNYFLTAFLSWLSWLSKTFTFEFKTLGQDLRRSFFKTFGKLPTIVWLEKNGVELEIPINNLTIGDIVIVNAGEMIPVDGVVVEGNAYINQYLLTGKSQLLAKNSNDQIFASNIVITGRILVKVDKWGSDTAIAKEMYTSSNNFYETG